MTESIPTNFHHFYKRKMLTANESPSDYREVSEAEKTALEASAAAWERPPQAFIDEVETLGMTWNGCTGYFELNGLTDITYKEALAIYEYTKDFCPQKLINPIEKLIRTNLLVQASNLQYNHLPKSAFFRNNSIEIIRISPDNTNQYTSRAIVNAEYAFYSCEKLREIYGAFTLSNMSSLPRFFLKNCPNLKTVNFIHLGFSLDISSLKSLSAESISFMITNAINSTPIVITVHPDVYAKLTDESNTEWNSLLEAAAAKNIQFATA